MLMAAVAFLTGPLAGTPTTWTPARAPLPPALTEGKPGAYHLFRAGTAQDPVDVGLEWATPQAIGALEVAYASVGGRAYEPAVAAQSVQCLEGDRWRSLPAALTVDYTESGCLAPLQGRGVVRWTYRFAPVRTRAVRVRATASAHPDPGFQCIAVASVRAGAPDGRPVAPGVTVRDPAPAAPAWLEPGADLAAPAAGAVHTSGSPATVRWQHPVMVDTVRAATAVTRVEARVGAEWRPVEMLPAPAANAARFVPIATDGLRVHGSRPLGRIEAVLSADGRRYFDAVRTARTDVLGERFRGMAVADLGAMQSLLLPVDFTKAAIGRPADTHETMVGWAGAFWQVEASECVEPRTGASLGVQAADRWFAPAVGTRAGPAAPDRMRTTSRWLDGWRPAVVTTSALGSIRVEQTTFVTAPATGTYATLVRLAFTNRGRTPAATQAVLAMGRRRMYAAAGEAWTPFLSDPQPTGYRLDADGRTVRSAAGDIMLHAMQAARWAGTEHEPHLVTPVDLAPGETRTLWFAAPSVSEPLRDAAPLARLDPDASLRAFRAYWDDFLARAAVLDLPEAPLNGAYRSLLAQCAIIGLDGADAKYGAYAYEAYFGVEEGWPAVALAQYGLAEWGRRIVEYMLSPACLDKANYHHQYRNGLAPWYAITIARLTGDDDWLSHIGPTLKACAEWTMAATSGNADARWGGVLPRHIYGGDISMPAFSFYSNAVCWRGLHDTATAFDRLGDAAAAARYREAARAYHRRLMTLADALVDRSTGIAFLPMAFGVGDGPTARDAEPPYPVLAAEVPASDTWAYIANYWNLFAPMLLEVRLFEPGSSRETWLPAYMEARGGVLVGQARFSLGFDCIYGKGYIENRLERGDRDGFLTSLYGLLAHGASRNLGCYPEVSGVFPLRTDNRALHREYERERWSWLWRPSGGWINGWQNQEGEPLSAGPGMALQLLRMALVREDFSEDPPTCLRVLDGAPTHWFAPRKRIAFKGLRTFLGPVSAEVRCALASATAVLVVSPAGGPGRLTVRLPSSDGRPIATATVKGGVLAGFTADEVTVTAPERGVTIRVTYARR